MVPQPTSVKLMSGKCCSGRYYIWLRN